MTLATNLPNKFSIFSYISKEFFFLESRQLPLWFIEILFLFFRATQLLCMCGKIASSRKSTRIFFLNKWIWPEIVSTSFRSNAFSLNKTKQKKIRAPCRVTILMCSFSWIYRFFTILASKKSKIVCWSL